MDQLELDITFSDEGTVSPAALPTLNLARLKLSAKSCPSVKRWTCVACTTMCTAFCAASDDQSY